MNEINPNQKRDRRVLRTVGPMVLVVGLMFLGVGFISFLASLGKFEPPRYFWCAFVGIPLTFVGLVLCKFAYMGKVARYTAEELAPVGKDTFNYMAKGTKEGVADVSEAFFEGMHRAGSEGNSVEARIEKLRKMKEDGLINEEDFEEQKDRILSEV